MGHQTLPNLPQAVSATFCILTVINMLRSLVGFLALVLPLCSAKCVFCLPECKQPPFPGNICDPSVVLSVKAIVLSNSTTICTGVCDGKGIALGNLKTIYRILVLQVFKGKGTFGSTLSVAGIRTFSTDPLRKGVNMDVRKIYLINLLAPMPAPIDKFMYIDRCDHPRLLGLIGPPVPSC